MFGKENKSLYEKRLSDAVVNGEKKLKATNVAQCAGCGARLRDEGGNCAYCGSGQMPCADRKLIYDPELVARELVVQTQIRKHLGILVPFDLA